MKPLRVAPTGVRIHSVWKLRFPIPPTPARNDPTNNKWLHPRLRLIPLLLLALAGASCESDPNRPVYDGPPTQWNVLEEPSLGFRIEFPGKPSFRNINFPSSGGVTQVYLFNYKHVAFEYGVSVMRVPPSEVLNENLQGVLDAAVQSLVSEHSGLLSFQESLELGGYPARRAAISLPETYLKDNRVHTLIVLRENHVYRVTTAGIGNTDLIQHFFNSFRITPIE